MTLDPSAIDPAEQEFGCYYFHPNIDGNVDDRAERRQRQEGREGGKRRQATARGNGARSKKISEPADELHVPWHVAPLAASKDKLSKTQPRSDRRPATR